MSNCCNHPVVCFGCTKLERERDEARQWAGKMYLRAMDAELTNKRLRHYNTETHQKRREESLKIEELTAENATLQSENNELKRKEKEQTENIRGWWAKYVRMEDSNAALMNEFISEADDRINLELEVLRTKDKCDAIERKLYLAVGLLSTTKGFDKMHPMDVLKFIENIDADMVRDFGEVCKDMPQ